MLVRQARIDPSTPMLTDQRHDWGRAYRDGEVVCGRVRVMIGRDRRLGLAPHERCYLSARFVGRIHPSLRAELVTLVRRRGAAARRAAEAMAQIELVFDDVRLGQIAGYVEPPQVRWGKLSEIEFGLREDTQ